MKKEILCKDCGTTEKEIIKGELQEHVEKFTWKASAKKVINALRK